MSTAEGWDDSWKQYPQMPGRREALRRIQATILGTAAPEPLPQKAETHQPAGIKAQGQPAAGQQQPDLDDAPTLPMPETTKQTSAAGQAEQAGAHAGSARAQRRTNPAIIACCILLAAAATAGTAIGARSCMGRKAYDSAISSCAQAKQEAESAYRAPYAETYRAALSIGAGQVKDPKTVQRLHTLAGRGRSPAPLPACKAGDSKDALNSRADRMRETAANRTRLNNRMAAAATAVLASRDAKSLDDAKAALDGKKDEASRLLNDSDGKVADNATRDGLQQAIDQAGGVKSDKAKAYQDAADALQAAMDQVNASMQQKSQADQAAQQRSAPSYSRGRQGYTPSYRPSYNRGNGGGSAPAPAAPAPAPAAPQGGGSGGFDWNSWVQQHSRPSQCQKGGACGIG